MIPKRKKAQEWGFVSISSGALAAPYQHRQHIHSQRTQVLIRGLPSAGEVLVGGGWPGASWAGNLVVQTGPGSGHASGPLSLGDLGHSAGTC